MSAQRTFDLAVDAIDRSGLSKELRQGLATELQEAFICLAREVGEDDESKQEDCDVQDFETRRLPKWAKIKELHEKIPCASSAVTVAYDDVFGRHIVADRQIEVGEVIFVEDPIVSYLDTESDASASESCHECFSRVGGGAKQMESPLIPCPGCTRVVFCSVRCRKRAWEGHHQYECRTYHIFRYENGIYICTEHKQPLMQFFPEVQSWMTNAW